MSPLQQPSIERLPDDLLLHILNYVSDIKSLGHCYAVSRRFRLLLPLVSSLLIPVDSFVLSSPDSLYPFSPTALLGRGSPVSADDDMYLSGFTVLSSLICSSLHVLLKYLGFNSSLPPPLPIPNPPFLSAPSVTHHTLVHQVLENFSHLRTLRIRLPSGELSLNDSSSALLRWRAHFGSSLSRCLVLAAAAADSSSSSSSPRTASESAVVAVADNDTIADLFYTELGVVLIISTLSVASERRCLLQPIISEHATLESVVLTDADGQGLLRMDRDQLEERRKQPISLLGKSKRMTPAFRMWYAPVVELSCGVVLKGATLVAVRPSSGGEKEEEDMGLGWIEEEFDGEEGDGMYAEAVRMLVKEGRTRYMKRKFYY